MHSPSRQSLRMDIGDVQPRLIWANEREVEPVFQKPYDTHGDTCAIAWLILEGSVRLAYGQSRVVAKAGEWVFLRNENGRQRFEAGSRLVSLRFTLRLRGGRPLFAPARDVVLQAVDHPALEAAARALVDRIKRVDPLQTLRVARDRLDLADNFRIETAFMAWLAAYVDAMDAAGVSPEIADERDARVGKALVLIEDHRMREKFSETALARRCGLGVNQLARLFRSEVGISPRQYYEKQRLELACHALVESRLPVKELAFELGFGSSSHFSNWFTCKTGRGPRAYRADAISRGAR